LKRSSQILLQKNISKNKWGFDEEMSEDDTKYLTEEEMNGFTTKYSHEIRSIDRDTLARMKNTVEKLEAEFKDVKDLKNFITTGVLVSPQLILSAHPSNTRRNLGMTLTALSERAGFGSQVTATTVELRVEDVDRLIRYMPVLLKAARLHRTFRVLKELHKEKTRGRGY